MMKAWFEKMEEKLKKCTQCSKTFPIDSHFRSVNKYETRQCAICRKMARTWNYDPNGSLQKRKAIYLGLKQDEIDKNGGCQWKREYGCDKKEIAIIEFDHLPEYEKTFTISQWPGLRKYNENDLTNEISKCRVLCRFHHKIHSITELRSSTKKKEYSEIPETVRSRKRKHENRKKIMELKVNIGECAMCERKVIEAETAGYDFDHLDGQIKYERIANLVRDGYSWKNTILPEIEKCRLICANCHAKHTKIQLQLRQEQKFSLPEKTRFRLPRDTSEIDCRPFHIHRNPPPEREELYALVKKNSFIRVGKMYGVNKETIRQWCKKRDIPHQRRKLI